MIARTDKKAKPLVLVGFMGSGKSTIGALLAEILELPFVDTDHEIEREFAKSIIEIFRNEGEPVFRQAERNLLMRLLDSERRVIAAGGGAFLDHVTSARLAAEAHTIWLDPPFERIRDRLARSFERPLVAARTVEELRNLWKERRQSYAKADVHFRISHEDPRAAAREIAQRLALI